MDTPPPVPVVAYDRIRPAIHTGDLLLCSGSSDFSRLIQRCTDSFWSHVGFVIRAQAVDRLLLMESVESVGVRPVSLRSYVEDYCGTGQPYPGRIYLARHAAMATAPAPSLEQFLEVSIDLLGYPYDRRDIVRIAARIAAAAVGYVAAPLVTERAYICSEYAAKCLAHLGITIPPNPRGYIAPADFAADPAITVLWEIALPS